MSETILISADSESAKHALPAGIVVKVNGRMLSKVVAFSEQEGWAEVLTGETDGDELLKRRFRGTVNVGRINQDQRRFYADAYPDRVEITGQVAPVVEVPSDDAVSEYKTLSLGDE